jgi:hypothetical protein
VGGEAGDATPFACTRLEGDVQCGTGPLGGVVCSENVGLFATHHGGAAWLHFPEPPPGFSDLHAFGCALSGQWQLPTRLLGALVPSFEQFPFIVWRDDENLTLYRGLPDEPSVESAPGEQQTLFLAGPNAVGWGDRIDDVEPGLVHFRLHEGPSLDIDAERATFELQGLVAESLYLHAGRPALVFERLEEGWVAGSLTGETPLGIRPNSTSAGAFLLDREPIAAAFAGLLPWSEGYAIVVSGADPEFSKAKLVEHLRFDDDWAERATSDPLSPDYVAAPVLWLDRSASRLWGNEVCDLPITDPAPYRREVERTGLQRVVFKLGRDSAGTPWLVTLRETGWGICTYTGTPAEEDPAVPARHDKKLAVGGSYLDLVLTRLALPPMESVHRLTEGDVIGRYELFMDGSIGTVVVDVTADRRREVSLWRVDLDAP